jgi:hypothetical protein
MGKSIISNKVSSSKSAINPCSSSTFFSTAVKNTLLQIEKYYTYNASVKTYNNIPNDYSKYLDLYTIIQNSEPKMLEPTINLLFKITSESLVSVFNINNLQYLNNELTKDNDRLRQELKEVQDELLLTDKFKKNTLNTTRGNVGVSQIFVLAPLFSYYIAIYGLPERGVGFNETKLSKLLELFKLYGIDPYNSNNNIKK